MNKPVLKIMCILLVVLLMFSACSAEEPETILTEEEVAILREKNGYIIYEEAIPDNASVSSERMTLREFIMKTETIAYCEVVKDPEYVETNVENIFNLDNYNPPKMRVHTVMIISDSEGVFDKGDVVTFCYGLSVQSQCPSPKVGDKIVIPMRKGYSDCPADVYASYYCYYYVTDSGNVISAFSEDSKNIYSGYTVKGLLNNLKKTDKEKEEYLGIKARSYERGGSEYGFTSIEMLKEQMKERIALRNSNTEK